jgi:hypothetical protein
VPKKDADAPKKDDVVAIRVQAGDVMADFWSNTDEPSKEKSRRR